jgi:hypothetical protein
MSVSVRYFHRILNVINTDNNLSKFTISTEIWFCNKPELGLIPSKFLSTVSGDFYKRKETTF